MQKAFNKVQDVIRQSQVEVPYFPKTVGKLDAKLLSNAIENNGETVQHKDGNQG